MLLRQNEELDRNFQNQDHLRRDLDAALHHLHKMSMQTKHDMIDATSRLFAMLEELIASGQIDLKSFEERRLRIQQKEEQRLQNGAIVYVANTVDKYKLALRYFMWVIGNSIVPIEGRS